MFFVYILQSKKDKTLYTGYSKDVKERLKFHNAGLVEYTKTRTPWKLMWCGMFASQAKATAFEKYLKSGSGIAFLRKRFIDTDK